MSDSTRLASIRRRARRNQLEVEHILCAAKERVPGLAKTLEKLIDECGWTNGKETRDGAIIPFRRWAITAAAYARGGYAAICELARDRAYVPFVFALLEELHSKEALAALLTISQKVLKQPKTDVGMALQTAQTLSHFWFMPPVEPSKPDAKRIRDFLCSFLRLRLSEAQRATGLEAFAGVGDKQSLKFIAAQPPLKYPWDGLKAEVLKAIRNRAQTAKLSRQYQALLQMEKRRNLFPEVRRAGTNGDNYGIGADDVIVRLMKWRRLSSFRITKARRDTLILKFDALPRNVTSFLRDAYGFCPDLEEYGLQTLKADLLKTKVLTLWWD